MASEPSIDWIFRRLAELIDNSSAGSADANRALGLLAVHLRTLADEIEELEKGHGR